MQQRRLRLFLVGWILILAGAALAHFVQTIGGVRVRDLRFAGSDGLSLGARLYLPPGATLDHKAPGILTVHDYLGSRIAQAGLAHELARRGYAVLTLDQPGHGDSDGRAVADGAGGLDGLRFLRGLAMVDAGNIGLVGDGTGGAAVLKAAAALPDGYRAMVLTGSGIGAAGSPSFPRDVAVIYGTADEFARAMWGVERAADVTRSEKLARLFGIAAEARPGRLYGNPADGSGRMLLTPPIIHPADGLSREVVAGSVSWFARTLKGGQPSDPYSQVWMWRELGRAIALAGLMAMLMGGVDLLLALPGFNQLTGPPDSAAASRDMTWWSGWVLASWVPVLGYFALLGLGATYLPAGGMFRQGVTNQILGWLVLTAGVNLALTIALRGDQGDAYGSPMLSLLIALVVAALAYTVVTVLGSAFDVEPGLGGLTLKALNRGQIGQFIRYLPGFTLAFLLILHNLHARLSVYADSAVAQYLSNIGALSAGLAMFLLVQYGFLFATGQLLSHDQPLNVILALQLLPMLAILAAIATFIWRRTGNVLPGAFLCGGLVTWYLVGSQAMQVAG